MLKTLYDKAALHLLMFGMALAAAIEIDGRFHIEHSIIFYSVHAVLITIVTCLLVYNQKALEVSLLRCVRDFIVLICVYGMAASSPMLAIYILPVLGILTSLYFYYERKRNNTLNLEVIHDS